MTNFDDNQSINDSETLLRRVIDIIATARTMPLSNSPMVNRDEIIELLEESLNRLPDELRPARWMLRERDEVVGRTKREAEDIVDAARAQAERMVQRTEVVRAAELRARQVVEAAESESRRMRHETEDFCDQRLASFEIVLEKVARTVANGRERLNIRGSRAAAAAAPDGEGDDGEDGGTFFDYDSE